MKKRTYHPNPAWDRTVWIGKFTGYRLLAWGKNQVLNADIEIEIRQEYASPAVWVARARPGQNDPMWFAYTAEECMSHTAAMFNVCVENWQAFTGESLQGVRKIAPTVIVNNKNPGR